MLRTRLSLSLGLAFAAYVFANAQASAGTVDLALPERSTTSAGVYDADGRLVRTLWSGRTVEAGPLAVDWDGRDDDGNPVAPTNRYSAKVLAHNVRYVWEGVIGNTSRDKVGAGVHRSFHAINDMAFDDAGNGFYVVGYNEGQQALHAFKTADPQRQIPLLSPDYRRVFRYAATDGQLAYFANVGLIAERGAFNRQPQTFVIATDVTTGEPHRFAAGNSPDAERTGWPSVIDLDRDDHDSGGEYRSAPTGLAVERRGEHLFVAHGRIGEIRVFAKRTGESVGRIAAAGVRDLDIGPDDSLWALSKVGARSTLARYRKLGDGWAEANRSEHDFADPVAIGVSPTDGTVIVIDAGKETLEAFDADGRPAWTLGHEGGYRKNGPAVTADKFWFSAGAAYVAFEPDGSFWVGDPGNVRNLHYSAERVLIDQIMYLPHSYVVAVDSNNSTRVFRHFLEFAVDYAAPLESSWRLAANWSAGLDRRYFGMFDGLQAVHTLQNRRTYGVVRRTDLGINEIVELTAAGLRPTGAKLEIGTKFYSDGSQRYHAFRFGGLKVLERPLEGFDADGDPQWGPPRELGGIAKLGDSDPYYHDVPLVGAVNEATYPITDSGVIVSFTPGRSQGFHLGGIATGSDRWLWRASPTASWRVDESGRIQPRDGSYDVGNGVQYPGNVVVASGRHIVYGYHGEAWRGGQANQWLHFHDSGLFIGQFGRPGIAGDTSVAPAEAAGNTFSPQLVTVNGEFYLWHNDESGHAGVHRWRIDGANQVRLLEATIEP